MPAGPRRLQSRDRLKRHPRSGSDSGAGMQCRRALTREPPASDTVSRKGSKPDGRDASAARFTRARSAASGCADQRYVTLTCATNRKLTGAAPIGKNSVQQTERLPAQHRSVKCRSNCHPARGAIIPAICADTWPPSAAPLRRNGECDERECKASSGAKVLVAKEAAKCIDLSFRQRGDPLPYQREESKMFVGSTIENRP